MMTLVEVFGFLKISCLIETTVELNIIEKSLFALAQIVQQQLIKRGGH